MWNESLVKNEKVNRHKTRSAASKLGNETMILKIHDIKMKSLN